MPAHFVISSHLPSTSGGLSPLGDRKTIIDTLGGMNTCPEQPGDNVLFGPGIRLEMREGEDPLKQILLSIVEEEIAWLVVARLAKTFNWKIMDVETGDEIEFVVEDVGP